MLLDINAVVLSPTKPFTWTSGLKSPIYCDNRLTLAYPEVRRTIANGLSALIRKHFPDVEIIAGTATAGIPHAAWVCEVMELPMVYVRGAAQTHGKGNLIEGVIKPKQRVVIVEDLISTGGSVIAAANALRALGCEVLGAVAIFSYQLPQSEENFAKNNLPYHYLSDYNALIAAATEEGIISPDQHDALIQWRQAPDKWQPNI